MSTKPSRGSSRGSERRDSTSCRLCALAFALAGLHASEGRPAAAREELPPVAARARRLGAGGLRRQVGGGHRGGDRPRRRTARAALVQAAGARACGRTGARGEVLPPRGRAAGRGDQRSRCCPPEAARRGSRTGVEVDVWVLSALVADRLREDNRALDALQRRGAARTQRRRPSTVRHPGARARTPAAGPPPAGGSGVVEAFVRRADRRAHALGRPPPARGGDPLGAPHRPRAPASCATCRA